MKRIICFLMLALVYFSTDFVVENTVVAAPAEDFSISLPKRIEDAVPFFVKVTMGGNAQVSVRWLGKDRKLALTRQGNGYVALGLFALPVDTPSGIQPLTLMINGKAYKYSLQSSKRTYRTQSLTVNQSYVVPPRQEMDKINKDKAERNMILATITPTRYWQEKGWVRPAQGLLTSPYGARRIYNGQSRNPHTALDFKAAVGAPIVAVAPGRIIFAGNQYFTGNTVYIDHGEGVISGYSHLSKILVQKGQMIRAGQRIGDAGATGRVTGPHLHLTMYSYGIPFDASSLLLPNGR